jgi:Uma2 family endonuclease
MHANPSYVSPSNPLTVVKMSKKPRLYTLGEYLQRSEKVQERLEYRNGIITKLPMARVPHNTITANVIAALKFALKPIQQPDKKYRICSGQQIVYLPQYNFGLYPDVLVLVEPPQCFDKNQVLLTNPLIIVEVLSRSTKKYDKTQKFIEYKSLESFQEYILIDQDKCQVDVFFQKAPHLWGDATFTNLTDTIFLHSAGCSISVADIYEDIIFDK